jgi:ABC-type branched-subunit amino acid transport system substrate-binding protein
MPAVGTSSRNAAELAVNELNAAGGINVASKTYKVKLLVEDNAASRINRRRPPANSSPRTKCSRS